MALHLVNAAVLYLFGCVVATMVGAICRLAICAVWAGSGGDSGMPSTQP